MEQIEEFAEVTRLTRVERRAGRSIGFVPTMGALHEGHLSLIRTARRQNEFVVVSIFVNPIQFEPGEDLETYPRTLERDIEICRAEGVDLVFTPTAKDMYPAGFKTFVEVETLGKWLCGRSRPTHFRGVSTVCAKLFNIVRTDRAYFGQKDYQQAVIVRRMVRDLNIPVAVLLCPIVREESGLALSSRNSYLSDGQRAKAATLYKALQASKAQYDAGERDPAVLIQTAGEALSKVPELDVEYIEIVDAEILEPVKSLHRTAVLAVAVHLDGIRLIDNVLLGELDWVCEAEGD
jgi:pantoate--beta-alanine ligase